MFKRIAVAFDESPEAGRAFRSALGLAKLLGSELYLITVVEDSAAIHRLRLGGSAGRAGDAESRQAGLLRRSAHPSPDRS